MQLRYDRIANSIAFSPREAAKASHALADALCWFQGFRAAGGDGANIIDLETLRSLNLALKELRWSHAEEEESA
jgi:hypothetical protein